MSHTTMNASPAPFTRRTSRRRSSLFLLFVCSLVHLPAALAFGMMGTPLESRSRSSTQRQAAFVTMYMPSSSPTSQTPPMASQKILSSSSKQRTDARRSSFSLSTSILASCDTLPSFPTAHGLLSPETVRRMEEMTQRRGSRCEALALFLDTYHEHGPMSCLPMLSDPHVLPFLTEAMRDIA